MLNRTGRLGPRPRDQLKANFVNSITSASREEIENYPDRVCSVLRAPDRRCRNQKNPRRHFSVYKLDFLESDWPL